MCYCMYVWFVVPLCQVVCGYTFVWPVIRGVTLSDYGLTTGFSTFNLPTCGSPPKVESGKHIYMSVGFIVVVVCLLSFCVYLFSCVCVWMGEYVSTQTLVIHHWAGPSVIAHLAPNSTPDRTE